MSPEGDGKERAGMSNWEYFCLLVKMAGMRIQIAYLKCRTAILKNLLWLMREGYV